MSFLIQTILIGILALIINIFSPAIAGWIVWGAYLLFSVGLFFKARDYRRRLLRGEESDLTGAMMLPPITITAIIILAIFLFIDLSKLHLLWILPLMALVYELLISRKIWESFESEIFKGKRKKGKSRFKEGQVKMFIVWLIISAVLIVVWEVLTRTIPEGWTLVPVNILFFMASIFIGAFGYLPMFRKRMRNLLAWLCALVLWFMVFVVIRGLLFPV